MKSYLKFYFVAFVIILVACKEDRSIIIRYGNFKGIVYDNFGRPCPDVLVVAGSYSMKTDEAGLFSFRVEVGNYDVTISKANYISESKKVTINGVEDAEIKFALVPGKTVLTISTYAEILSCDKDTITVSVASNVRWTVKSRPNWIVASTGVGEGDGSVNLYVQANTGDLVRSDTVEIVAGDVVRKIAIKQGNPIKVIDTRVTYGNYAIGIKDSVYISFNKPIVLDGLASNYELCISDNTPTLSADRKQVRFAYTCAYLGGSFPFTVQAHDEFNSKIKERVVANFYKNSKGFEGKIVGSMFLNSDSELLISTINPSRLIRYSIDENSIVETVDLSNYIAPLKISYNPKNSKVYILGTYPKSVPFFATINIPDIYSYNLNTNAINKEVLFSNDRDHYLNSSIITNGLEFTSSGNGLAIVGMSNTYYPDKVKQIEYQDDGLIFHDITLSNSSNYNNLYPNFNHSEVFVAGETDVVLRFRPVDGKTGAFTPLSTCYSAYLSSIQSKKDENKILLKQKDGFYIMDLNSNECTPRTISTNFEDLYFEFSCRKDDNNLLFYGYSTPGYGYTYLELLDMNSSTKVFKVSTSGGISKFISTTDGKTFIALHTDAYGNSKVFTFDSSGIYKKFAK